MAQELVPLGKLILDPTTRRDCFHIACVPAIALHELTPGQRVAIRDWEQQVGSGERVPIVGDPVLGKDAVGIVDAFLVECAPPQSRCWVFLTPNTVTGLRHAFKSPDFPDEMIVTENPEAEARKRLLASIPGARR